MVAFNRDKAWLNSLFIDKPPGYIKRLNDAWISLIKGQVSTGSLSAGDLTDRPATGTLYILALKIGGNPKFCPTPTGHGGIIVELLHEV